MAPFTGPCPIAPYAMAQALSAGTSHQSVWAWDQSSRRAQQARLRKLLKLPTDFVLHSLRHRSEPVGEVGADAFTIMKLMGHSSVHGFAALCTSLARSARDGVRAHDEPEYASVSTTSATLSDVAVKCVAVSLLFTLRPGGEIGRRNGLKIRYP